MSPGDTPTPQLIAQYQRAKDAASRGELMWELLTRTHPAIPQLAFDFLQDAARHPPAHDNFDHWMAQARALLYFGVVKDIRIYEDWRSPFIDAIQRDVRLFLEQHPAAPQGSPLTGNPRSADTPSSAGLKRPQQFSPRTQKILTGLLLLIFLVTLPFWLAFVLPIAPFWKTFRRHNESRHGNGRIVLALFGVILFGSALLGVGYRYFAYARFANQYETEGIILDANVIEWEIRGSGRSKQYVAEISFTHGSLLDGGEIIFNEVEVMGINPSRNQPTLEIIYLPDAPTGKIFSTFELQAPYQKVSTFFWVALGIYLLTSGLFWYQVRQK